MATNKEIKGDKGLFGDEFHNTWILLAQTYRLISNLWDRDIEKLGFTREQAYAVYIIHHLGERATPSKISELQFQAHNTTSEILNRMVKQGLIKKFKEPDGRDRIKIRLTPKGRQVFLLSRNREALHKVLSALPPDKLRDLQDILKVLRDEAMNLKK